MTSEATTSTEDLEQQQQVDDDEEDEEEGAGAHGRRAGSSSSNGGSAFAPSIESLLDDVSSGGMDEQIYRLLFEQGQEFEGACVPLRCCVCCYCFFTRRRCLSSF